MVKNSLMSLPKSDAILDRLLSLHPKIIDLSLDRVFRLLTKLGNPEQKLPQVIHIAGTNGKGSTQAMLRAGIEGFGASAHAYISPHLTKFHERIRVAGSLISENALTEVLNECELENAGDPITYFEITTCAAFLAFSRAKADYTLLEVGLGGRLDATNVLKKPKLTILTPISLDHVQFLGNNIQQIAYEKAGIIKEGVPCIVGPQNIQALSVIKTRANELSSPLKIYGQHWDVYKKNKRLIFEDDVGSLELPLPKLIGAHQVNNAGVAIAAMRELRISNSAYKASMENVYWPARMQRLKNGPLVDLARELEVWLDGGHNLAAGMAISDTLEQLPHKQNILICGMLKTKDVMGYLKSLYGQANILYGITVPGEEGTNSSQDMIDVANAVGFSAVQANNVMDAIQRIAKSYPKGRILICGSLYLAGTVLQNNS
jgi:dihydrofolate synthase/folylpolyglutamate synthase